jgi:hypothetical protein
VLEKFKVVVTKFDGGPTRMSRVPLSQLITFGELEDWTPHLEELGALASSELKALKLEIHIYQRFFAEIQNPQTFLRRQNVEIT